MHNAEIVEPSAADLLKFLGLPYTLEVRLSGQCIICEGMYSATNLNKNSFAPHGENCGLCPRCVRTLSTIGYVRKEVKGG